MKFAIIKKLLPGFLFLSSVINPVKLQAEDNTDTVRGVPSLEELSGVSSEQMQSDFENQHVSEPEVQQDNAEEAVLAYREKTSDQFIYLSDLPYDASSKAGWGSIRTDLNVDGQKISLKIGGTAVSFEKGMGAHATSYLIYDISEVKDRYSVLSTYAGVDSSKIGKSDGVSFHVWGSTAGGSWIQITESGRIRPEDDAQYFYEDVSAFDRIRLEARVEGSTASDHAVYGELRLLAADYDISSENYSGILTMEEYDRDLSSRSPQENFSDHRLTVLKREFVSRIGYQTVQYMYRNRPEQTAAALDWLLNDQSALQQFIEAGGYFSGSGYQALQSLICLYDAYQEDLITPVYQKMLLATAAAYSKSSRPFIVNYGGLYETPDPVEKYRLMKQLYNNGLFIRREEFESYPMELMRMVMDTKINNSEILWLRDYIESKYPAADNWKRFSGYGYAAYRAPDYGRSDFYDAEQVDAWNEKYGFLQYGIPYGQKNLYRIWMLMEGGSICWGLAGLGIVVNELQGIASLGTYQPGHEAYLVYSTDDQGRGIWNISDDIAGWGSSFSRWGSTAATEYRLPLEWGVKSYNILNSGCNTSYILLAQDALNSYDSYLPSMYYSLIANSYGDGSDEKEETLNLSLAYYDKNLDAYYGLYRTLAADRTTADEEWSRLAERIVEAYTYFPAPMTDLIRLIRAEMDEETNRIETDIWKADALQKASNATKAESLQDKACRQVASSLLGKEGKPLATFSFDGSQAGTVVISEEYSESVIQVRISLDDGETWETFGNDETFTADHEIVLTEEQIARINADDDILVGLMGISTNHRIDIQEGKDIPSTVFFNDREGMLFGSGTEKLLYSRDGGITWQDYVDADGTAERFTGNETVQFRTRATGTTLIGKTKEYRFTESTDPDTRRYVYVNNLSMHSFSSQTNADHAAYIIDGNDYTGWHTNTASEPESEPRTAVIMLDRVRYITALEYMSSFTNGKLKRGEIYTSLDGNTWTYVMSTDVFRNDASVKKIDFPKPVAAKYVKIFGAETYGHLLNTFFTCRTLSFFEDVTRSYTAEPMITYSETEPTQNNVTAVLKLPEGCTAAETEFEFSDNGSHQFIYFDADGKECHADAEVSWIDRTAPGAVVSYSTTAPVSTEVIASLTEISENDVEILSEGGLTHTFTDNGTFTFVLRDRAGNVSQIEATVTWIDRTAPVLGAVFDKDSLTNTDVTAELTGLEDGDMILGSGSSVHVFTENGTYVFEVMDQAGNLTRLEVTVSWIDKEAPQAAVEYSTEMETSGPVMAAVVSVSEPVRWLDGTEGTVTFVENGTHTFVMEDLAGNRTELDASVTWISDTVSEPERVPVFVQPTVQQTGEAQETASSGENAGEPVAQNEFSGLEQDDSVRVPAEEEQESEYESSEPVKDSSLSGNEAAEYGIFGKLAAVGVLTTAGAGLIFWALLRKYF